MPRIIKSYVRIVEAVNYRVGRMAMYLIFYLVILRQGTFDAAGEVLGHMERSATSFRPYLWSIITIATLGIFLMRLQVIAVFFKDIATIRGEDL